MEPDVTLDELTAYYNRIYWEWRDSLTYAPDMLLDELEARLPPGARVLDWGCGYGRQTLHLAGLRHQVISVDPSIVGIALLEERAEELGLLAQIKTVVDMPFEEPPPGPFDAVLLTLVLHHYPLPVVERMLAAAADRLAPGGRILVTLWLLDPDTGEAPAVGKYFPATGAEVDELVTAAGLSVEQTHCYDKLDPDLHYYAAMAQRRY
jgi:SAM-dependent methyltransferase